MKTITALTILFAATLTCLSADIPKVTSKAAKELLKHPEFKKALEAAPEFTKAVLKELDKHAPEDVKPRDDAKFVSRWKKKKGKGGTHPQYTVFGWTEEKAQEHVEHLANYCDGWDFKKLKSIYGRPDTYGDALFFRVGENRPKAYEFYIQDVAYWNSVTKRAQGCVYFYLDRESLKVVQVRFYLSDLPPLNATTGLAQGVHVKAFTPTGKKLGYK